MEIAILTTPNQWFVPYAKELQKKIKNSELFFNYLELNKKFDIVFILSYHSIINKDFLIKNKHNIVIHASDLPKGKGWSPMFWQILEGKNEIPFTMFEASEDIDSGEIYMKRNLILNGNELNYELRKKQAIFTINMCLEFIKKYDEYKVSIPQIGKETFYPKRTPKDSELDINKTINEQFNLLRIVDNENYPAFFYKNNKKYIIKIEEVKSENR